MAFLNSSTLTEFTEMTECCICLNTFTDPRMLPCIHTFCFHCLKEMVDKSDKKPRDGIQCPMCRKEFTLPSDGVQGIQKNFFMAGMIALNQAKLADIPCDVCKTNNGGTESNIAKATLRCLECQENLCEERCKMHKAFKVWRNHKVLKIDDEVGEGEAVKNLNVMNCGIHRGKILDCYCADCKKVVCVSCFGESHRTHDCKDVNTVEEEFRQMIKSSADQISMLAAELLAKKEKSESKKGFLMKIAVTEMEILQKTLELKKMIDQHAQLLPSTLYEIKSRRLKEILAREDEMDRNLIIVESFKRYCDELILKGSASDVCRSKDELLRRAEVIEEDHETYIIRSYVSWDVAFSATDISNDLKSTNGNMVGSLKEKDECLEAFAVMIPETRLSVPSYKINLHRKSDNVSLIEDLPTTVQSFPASAVYNNTVFITGNGDCCNEIWKFNFSFGWKRCGSLVQGRQRHCSEFIDETLYICGGNKPKGFFSGSVINSVEAYNAVTERSTMIGELRIGSECSDCVAYKGSIFVFGGSAQDGNELDCVQVFNPVEKTCILLSTPIPRPIAHMRALPWNEYAILLGRQTCFVLDLENRIWQEREQFKIEAEAARFGAVLENEHIFIIDGFPLTDLSLIGLYYRKERNLKYIGASSILNNEAPKWRLCGQLTKPFNVCAVPKMPLVQRFSTFSDSQTT